jgi:hypothetical protein
VVPLAGIVHQPHERVKSWSQDNGITCAYSNVVLWEFRLMRSDRYLFSVNTIMAAKEDSLLLPPELMHDTERRCDSSRRQVFGSARCLFYVIESQVQARRQRRAGPHALRRARQLPPLASVVPRRILVAHPRGKPYRAPSR